MICEQECGAASTSGAVWGWKLARFEPGRDIKLAETPFREQSSIGSSGLRLSLNVSYISRSVEAFQAQLPEFLAVWRNCLRRIEAVAQCDQNRIFLRLVCNSSGTVATTVQMEGFAGRRETLFPTKSPVSDSRPRSTIVESIASGVDEQGIAF